MPKPGSIIGDILEVGREQGGKIVKEVASVPIDIVKASFDQPIPNPTAERTQQIKAEDKARLAKIRSGLSVMQDSPPPQKEEARVQQGAETAERGQVNQNAARNQLSASMTPKKKPEPLVVQQKRNNKLHGAG